MSYRLKGNAHVSRGRIIRALERMSQETRSAEDPLYQIALERYESSMKVCASQVKALFRQGRAEVARMVAFPKPPGREDVGFSTSGPYIEILVEKIAVHNNHANQCSGHRFNAYRDSSEGGGNGGGFCYRPEIPWVRAGNGESCSLRLDLDYQDLDEQSAPRFSRRFSATEQSMPKVEWSVCRKWKNRQAKMRRRAIRDSLKLRDGLAAARREADRYFSQHGTIPNATFDYARS